MERNKIVLGVVLFGLMFSKAHADGLSLGTANLEERIAVLEGLVIQLQQQIENSGTAIAGNAQDIASNGTAIAGNAQAIASNGTAIAGNAQAIASNGSSIAAANNVLQYVSVVNAELNGVAGPHFIIEGVNVHVRSGYGSTGEGCNAFNAIDCPTRTGLGNLIVGYNEPRNLDTENVCASDPDAQDEFGRSICVRREGAHHLVVGVGNNFVGHGGAVLGLFNEVKGSHATVTGGRENAATQYASVSGGVRNVASRSLSSVSGGWGNRADGSASSVSGGKFNTASGEASSVSGGTDNLAGNFAATVSGGINSLALGSFSAVSGGDSQIANGTGSSISGGQMKTANAPFCTVGDNGTDC